MRAICALFHKLGSKAEVVSAFEYNKALNLGVAGKDIIYNGPDKTRESLIAAIGNKSKIHLDCFDEITTLESLAKEMNTVVEVGIRLNLDCGIYPQWSKFGFNLESGEALAAAARIASSQHLKLSGLHCHIGTFVLDSAAHSRALEKLLQFAGAIKKAYQISIQYYDLGGGFPSLSRLKGIYQPPEVVVPDISLYAQSICAVMNEHFKGAEKPELYLECGRHLIDEAGYLLTSVKSSKMTPDGRRNYIIDAGVNLLYTSTWYDFNVELDRQKNNEIAEPSLLSGPLCMNIDVIEERMLLPRLENEQILTLSPVGAYNVTQSMQFINCRPAVVLVRNSGEVAVIRRQETLADIEIAEMLPEDLQ